MNGDNKKAKGKEGDERNGDASSTDEQDSQDDSEVRMRTSDSVHLSDQGNGFKPRPQYTIDVKVSTYGCSVRCLSQ